MAQSNGMSALRARLEKMRKETVDRLRARAQAEANKSGKPVEVSFEDGRSPETFYPETR